MPFESIQTDRLVLRPPEPGDAPCIHRLIGEWEVARMTANVPHPYEDGMAEDWIAKSVRELEAGEAYHVAVTRSDTPDLIGAVGLGLPEQRAPVLGYWIGRPYWGQGYATEAAGGLVAFGFDALGVEKVIASVMLENLASGRVLDKLGFVRTGRQMHDAPARSAPQAVDMYALTRAAFEAGRDG